MPELKPETVNIDMSVLPEVTNPNFYPLFLCKDRYLVMYGGAGSGKSYFALEKILLRIIKAIGQKKIHKFLCLRKTKPAARHSVFSLALEYIDSWGLKDSVKINKTEMTITFLGGSQLIITGMDDPEKIKSIHGITGVWLEEATEFDYNDFQQIDLRIRGNTWDYKQIILTFNPIDERHWIRQKIFDDRIQDEIESGNKTARKEWNIEVDGKTITFGMTIMHSTYKDNRFIDDVYKARLESLIEQDSNYHKIYTLGVWGVLRGLIFENFTIVNEWPAEFEAKGYGMDFGFSIDPTAIVEAGFIGDTLYLKEHCYETGLTNKDISVKLKVATENSPTRLTVADSAEPKSIAEIRQFGHPCFPAYKGPDSVLHGIQRLKQYKLCLDYNSPNLRKEFQGYKWAEDRHGNFLQKPVDFNNHLIDATRYIVGKLKGATVNVQFSEAEKTDVEKFEDGLKKMAEQELREDVINISEHNEDIWDEF